MISESLEELTSQELIAEYISAKATLSPNSQKLFRTQLHRFARFLSFKEKELLEVEEKDIAEYLAQYRYKKTKTTYKTVFSGFYKWCIKRKLMDENPTDDIVIKSGLKKKKEVMTEKDYKRFLTQCEGLREYTLISFFWFTGVRAKELRHVKLEDVDFDNSMIFVAESKTDSGIRKIPIHVNFLRLLKKYLAKRSLLPTSEPWLFLTKRGTQFSERSIIHLISKLQLSWNGPFSCHDFRRAFITRLYRATNDLVLCQRLAGHSDISTTRGYILDDMTEHAKKFNAVDF
ncbi:MAG: site-specific integrase [Candidatus Heimdallarchaeota archaeon]|nr:site-specific integrase [Candidatus Heimdallarchaeota archaeon]